MVEMVEWAERWGTRDLSYVKWHKATCGRDMCAVDIDSVEYCMHCGELLALIELAQDIGQKQKSTAVTVRLASLANLPAYLVFYKRDDKENMISFRVSQLCPQKTAEEVMDPLQYQLFLMGLRYRHKCYISDQSRLKAMIRNLAHFVFKLDGQTADGVTQLTIDLLEARYPRSEGSTP